MEKELNIAAILKDKPVGTKLYSPCCGVCTKGDDGSSKRPITLCLPNRALYHLLGNGKEFESGEIMVYPSKEMRDWSKFAWKKGDVLKCGTDRFCIFDTWSNDDYTKFEARCITPTYISADVETNMYIKANDTEKAEFIKELEKYWGGKLNLDTLRVEKPEPQFKDGDIVFVDNHIDNYILIMSDIQPAGIRFYALLYCSNGELKLKSRNCSISIYSKNDIRLATDSEKEQLFAALAKEGKRWNAETKTLEDLPKKCEFKAFDWCLMRDVGEIENKKVATSEWALCQFSHYLGDCKIAAVGGNWFSECIPYNEKTAHLLGTTDDYEE